MQNFSSMADAALQRSMNAPETEPSEINWQNEVQLPETTGGFAEMKHDLPPEAIEAPMSSSEEYLGSLKGLLNKNRGHYAIVSFLIGTTTPVSWEGILYEVGNDYIVLYQENYDRYIVGDIYALKFVEFPQSDRTSAGQRQRDGAAIW